MPAPSPTASRPGPKLKGFVCPECGKQGTAVVSQPPRGSDESVEARRRYRCKVEKGGCGELFWTTETVDGYRLGQIVVKSAKGEHGYDKERLIRSLRERIPKTLSQDEHKYLYNQITDQLHTELDQRRWRGDSKRPRFSPGQMLQIVLDVIMDLADRPGGVGDVRERYKAAHAQYALAALGQANDLGKPAWADAGDFMKWLAEQHPGLTIPDRHPHAFSRRPADLVWRPPVLARPDTIQTVVKNFRPDDADRVMSNASRHERDHDSPDVVASLMRTARPRRPQHFRASAVPERIERAMRGRGKARPKGARPHPSVDDICEWVLWGFVGQSVVRSSQISSSIAEALRSIDDIAYLRWTAIGKELSVEQLMIEAAGLRDFPSPRLRILREADEGARRRIVVEDSPGGRYDSPRGTEDRRGEDAP